MSSFAEPETFGLRTGVNVAVAMVGDSDTLFHQPTREFHGTGLGERARVDGNALLQECQRWCRLSTDPTNARERVAPCDQLVDALEGHVEKAVHQGLGTEFDVEMGEIDKSSNVRQLIR